MSSTHTSPTVNQSYYIGRKSSIMLSASPSQRPTTHDNLKRTNLSAISLTSNGYPKIQPPSSFETEKSEVNVHRHRKNVAPRASVNSNIFIDPGKESLMIQRKEEKTELPPSTSEETRDQTHLTEIVKQKMLENDALRTEIFRLESELRNCKRSLKTATSNEENFNNNGQLSEQQLKEILQSLNIILAKSEEAYQNIEKRCTRLEELINYIDSGVLSTYKGLELKALTDKLQHIVDEFKPSSQLEIEVGTTSRELVKKKLDLAYLNTRYQKMTTRCEALQHDLNILRQTLKAGHTEKNIFVRNLTKEKSLNRETQKKLGNLQKTLEILLEGQPPRMTQATEADYSPIGLLKETSPPRTNDSQVMKGEEKELNTTKLREALSKLVKENESLRRVIHVRDKEIEKLSDNLSKTVWKLNKAMIRIDKLRNQKSGHKMNDGTQDEEDLLVFYLGKKADITNLSMADAPETNSKGLPKNLDFRFCLFQERYVDLINDVLEGGSQAFAEHVRMLTSDEELKEEVTLISNQFVSYRNFAEKMNRLMLECFTLFALKTFNEVMVHISLHTRQILGASNVRVWVHEAITGTYRTMETPEKELKCLMNKGLIAEAIKTSGKILKRSQENKYIIMELLHQDGTSSPEKAQTCLLVPFKHPDGQILGVLEVSKFSYEAFLLDLDYFAQMLAELCVVLWVRNNRERILLSDLKMKEMYFDAFADLAVCVSQKEFIEKVEEWVCRIFQSSCTRYVIVDNSELITFSKDGAQKVLNGSTGIIGRVATQKKPFVVLEASGSSVHSENVDINTTFPLYTTPVMMKTRWSDRNTDEKNVIIGVLQMVMNQKSLIKENMSDENLVNHVKMIDPNTENLVSKFIALMAIAYDVMGKRIKNDNTIVQTQKKRQI